MFRISSFHFCPVPPPPPCPLHGLLQWLHFHNFFIFSIPVSSISFNDTTFQLHFDKTSLEFSRCVDFIQGYLAFVLLSLFYFDLVFVRLPLTQLCNFILHSCSLLTISLCYLWFNLFLCIFSYCIFSYPIIFYPIFSLLYLLVLYILVSLSSHIVIFFS